MKFRLAFAIPATLLAIALSPIRTPAQTQCFYKPIGLPSNGEISGDLSASDIPTGQGGFSKDYTIDLKDGDNITIDLTSENFDTIVSLMTPDGLTVAENDDGPDGSTNSLLFHRITSGGTYIVRVRAFGEPGLGSFALKLTRLRPVQ